MQPLCAHLNEAVAQLVAEGREERDVVFVQSIRARVLYELKNEGKKGKGKEALNESELEPLAGLIPDDLKSEFKKYANFCLEVITPRWCEWILSQLGEKSFEGIRTNNADYLIIFPGRRVQTVALLSIIQRIVKSKINRKRAIKILHLVHQGAPVQRSLSIVKAEIEATAREAEIRPKSRPISIPPDLQQTFTTCNVFSLDIITPRWCEWILAQLGKGSFEEVSVNSEDDIFIFTCQKLKFTSFLTWLSRKIDKRQPRSATRRILHLVHQGVPFHKAIDLTAAERKVEAENSSSQFDAIPIPPDLAAEFASYEEFCLEVITPPLVRVDPGSAGRGDF